VDGPLRRRPPGSPAVRIVLVRDGAGPPVLLLPLALTRSRGICVAAPLGGKQANFHLPVMARGAGRIAPEALDEALRRAGRRLGADLYVFSNLPLAWDGEPNPLTRGGRPSPSHAYRLALEPDAERTLARATSSSKRRKARTKERALGALGRVTFRTARTAEEADVILSAFFAQKAARFRAMGVSDPFADEGTRAFLRAAATEGLAAGDPAIELSALFLDERVLATNGAAVDRRRCCGMFLSFDADPALSRYSPGELLLLHVVAAQCAAGRSMFDLGVGDDPYKTSFCPEVEPLVDAVLPITPLGRLYALAQGGAVVLKRRIKQTPWLWSAVGAVRRWRAAVGP
jgi:CelD/BcsL family acetyltransferase involved in cellulose biosynthesis